MLLLGPADSGKTTVLKQLLLHHGKKYEKEEKELFRITIYQNILTNMKKLIDAMEFLELKFETKHLEVHSIFDRKKCGRLITESSALTVTSLSEKTVDAIKDLWKAHSIKECYESIPVQTTLN